MARLSRRGILKVLMALPAVIMANRALAVAPPPKRWTSGEGDQFIEAELCDDVEAHLVTAEGVSVAKKILPLESLVAIENAYAWRTGIEFPMHRGRSVEITGIELRKAGQKLCLSKFHGGPFCLSEGDSIRVHDWSLRLA